LSQIVSGIVAAPLAAGLMSLDGTAGLHGWQVRGWDGVYMRTRYLACLDMCVYRLLY
jgi:hypothetical protein